MPIPSKHYINPLSACPQHYSIHHIRTWEKGRTLRSCTLRIQNFRKRKRYQRYTTRTWHFIIVPRLWASGLTLGKVRESRDIPATDPRYKSSIRPAIQTLRTHHEYNKVRAEFSLRAIHRCLFLMLQKFTRFQNAFKNKALRRFHHHIIPRHYTHQHDHRQRLSP